MVLKISTNQCKKKYHKVEQIFWKDCPWYDSAQENAEKLSSIPLTR